MRVEARAQLPSLANIENLPASAFRNAKDYVNSCRIVKIRGLKVHTFKRQPANCNCHRSGTHLIISRAFSLVAPEDQA